MTYLSGSCLCGAVSFSGECDIQRHANCHCTSCQQATGAPYASILFVPADQVEVRGEVARYEHESDRGSRMTKSFCPTCGSPLFNENSMREGVLGLRAGSIEQKDAMLPTMNIFCDSAIPSTPMDEALDRFGRMPG